MPHTLVSWLGGIWSVKQFCSNPLINVRSVKHYWKKKCTAQRNVGFGISQAGNQ